jgi:hypothetical protein
MAGALAIDLFCGLGGWSEGLLAEGWDVIGFDIEQHEYWVPDTQEDDARKNAGGSWFAIGGPGQKVTKQNPDSRNWDKSSPRTKLLRYPGSLVIQDVLTLHGSQFRNADLIVASPPCQAYSYRAMPWKRAKALPPPDNTLFESCFRIQREACEAASRHIPLIVENVRGAQKWVGRARWNYGSFYLWGDVPALMPPVIRAQKFNPDGTQHGQGSCFAIADSKNRGGRGLKTENHVNKRDGHEHTRHLTNHHESLKARGFRFGGNGESFQSTCVARTGANSRKAASAMIAKIPLPLARHIARSFKPIELREAA